MIKESKGQDEMVRKGKINVEIKLFKAARNRGTEPCINMNRVTIVLPAEAKLFWGIGIRIAKRPDPRHDMRECKTVPFQKRQRRGSLPSGIRRQR